MKSEDPGSRLTADATPQVPLRPERIALPGLLAPLGLVLRMMGQGASDAKFRSTDILIFHVTFCGARRSCR